MHSVDNLDVPFDMNTRYLHGINARLDAICAMLSSLITHIAIKDGVATTSTEVVQEVVSPPTTRRKKV